MVSWSFAALFLVVLANADAVCEKDYVMLGCYREYHPENMLFNDRHTINWNDIVGQMTEMACKCAKQAKEGGFSGFALHFYGECYGKTNAEIQEIFAKGRHEPNLCVGDQKYDKCDVATHDHCIGGSWAEGVYAFKTVAAPVNCSAGTRYLASTRRCEVCPKGSYQDLPAKIFCKSCASGFSTVGHGSENHTLCKRICSPGTYSSTGLATCLACAKGTYQDKYNSTSCISCQSLRDTVTTGADSEMKCLKIAINVSIRAEGCNDPGAKGCGFSVIIVDGVDRSLHRRGYNLVVMNENTGVFEQARSFDTYGDAGAGVKIYNFVKDEIPNGRIVLVAVEDDGSRKTEELWNALTMLKGTEPFQTDFRGAFAMLGYKGSIRPYWLRQKMTNRYGGPVLIDSIIPLQWEI